MKYILNKNVIFQKSIEKKEEDKFKLPDPNYLAQDYLDHFNDLFDRFIDINFIYPTEEDLKYIGLEYNALVSGLQKLISEDLMAKNSKRERKKPG